MSVAQNRSILWDRIFVYGFLLAPTTVIFLITWWYSLDWDTVIDVPVFLYTGFLMDHFNMVPVRDFFTYNLLTTHEVFRWLYHFFGSSNRGMRIADTSILVVILPLMARMLVPFGRRAVWIGAIGFGLLHIRYGALSYLQRDYLALVPLSLMVLSATAWFGAKQRLRWILSGFFCGALVTIKPHLIVGGMVIYLYMIMDRDSEEPLNWRQWGSRGLSIFFYFSLGGCLPLLWMAAYFAYYGVLGEFVRTIVEFFPLHADISGRRSVFEPGERLPYLVYMTLLVTPWGDFQLAVGAVTGVALFLFLPGFDKRERRFGNLMLALLIVYLLYPCLAGRFYEHHYYPFRFFACAWLAFCFRKWPSGTPVRVNVFSRAVSAYIIVSLFYSDPSLMFKPVQTLPSSIAPEPRTKRIATWLERRLQPGDTIQPIEWGFCGIIHAALLTEAKVATDIIWAEGLFHHLSNPFIQDLRKKFIQDLTENKPRFVIRSKMDWDYMSGRDCSQDFEELDALLKRDYFLAIDSRDFRIWEHNDSPTADEDRARAPDDSNEKRPVDPQEFSLE
ncbi:MAG: hypothetical protein K1Y02_02530 [Candidatus Hydrogenedentes bacterium]|nr:hypothetical protein [Candidatus Hydrogenedentota bacterium]